MVNKAENKNVNVRVAAVSKGAANKAAANKAAVNKVVVSRAAAGREEANREEANKAADDSSSHLNPNKRRDCIPAVPLCRANGSRTCLYI